METKLNDILNQITQFMESEAKTDTVIGEAFELGEFSCIPVIKVGMGFGTGGGEGDAPQQGHGTGAGAGAGMGIQPMGFLVSRGSEISFISVQSSKGLAATFEKVPELITKLINSRQVNPNTQPELTGV